MAIEYWICIKRRLISNMISTKFDHLQLTFSFAMQGRFIIGGKY